MQNCRTQNQNQSQYQSQLPDLVNHLNSQLCELESLMEKLHFSLSELQLAHPNISAPLSDAALLRSDVPLREPLEFPLARISLC